MAPRRSSCSLERAPGTDVHPTSRHLILGVSRIVGKVDQRYILLKVRTETRPSLDPHASMAPSSCGDHAIELTRDVILE